MFKPRADMKLYVCENWNPEILIFVNSTSGYAEKSADFTKIKKIFSFKL